MSSSSARNEGGIGFSSFGGSRCKASAAFSDPVVIAQLANSGVFLTVYLVVVIFWLFVGLEKPKTRRILPWYFYGFVLLLNVASFTLNILWICLFNCSMIGQRTELIIALVANLAEELARLLVLGIVLLPCTIHLLHIAGQDTRLVRHINNPIFAVACGFFIPTMVMLSMSSLPTITSPHISAGAIIDLRATYDLICVVAAAVGAIFILFAMIKAAGDHALSSTVKLWALLTVTTLLLSNIIVAIQVFRWVLPKRPLTNPANIVFTTMTNIFATAPVISVLLMISNTEHKPYDPTDDATYDPEDPIHTRPEAHKPFTYAGANGSHQQQSLRIPRYSYQSEHSPLPSPPLSPPLSPQHSRQASPIWPRSRTRLSTIHSMEIAPSPTVLETVADERNMDGTDMNEVDFEKSSSWD